MNEIIGAAVYLILALAVAAGIRAVLAARPRKKPDRLTAPTRSPSVAATSNIKRAQRQDSGANHQHALPWVIPTALAPAGTCVETKKAAAPVKTIAERLEIIESGVDRIIRHLAGGQRTITLHSAWPTGEPSAIHSLACDRHGQSRPSCRALGAPTGEGCVAGTKKAAPSLGPPIFAQTLLLPATVAVPMAPVTVSISAIAAGVPAAAPAIANQAHLIGLDTVCLDDAKLVDWKSGSRSRNANREGGSGKRQLDDVHGSTPLESLKS